MAITRKLRALGIIVMGAALVCVGVGKIYLPAALVLAGVALILLGLFVVGVDESK